MVDIMFHVDQDDAHMVAEHIRIPPLALIQGAVGFGGTENESKMNPYYGTSFGLTLKELENPMRSRDEEREDFILKETNSSSESQEQKWLEPITGKPSKTVTGVHFANLFQDPTKDAYGHRLNPSSRVENLLTPEIKEKLMKKGLFDQEFLDSLQVEPEDYELDIPNTTQSEEQWGYFPNWYTAYFGNVGWLIPQGFAIDTTVQMYAASCEKYKDKLSYLFLTNISIIPSRNPGLSNWVNQVSAVPSAGYFGVSTGLLNKVSVWVLVGKHKYWYPSEGHAAFGRNELENTSPNPQILDEVASKFNLRIPDLDDYGNERWQNGLQIDLRAMPNSILVTGPMGVEPVTIGRPNPGVVP